MATIIKKAKSNHYLLTSDRLWVRDMTKPGLALDINNLVSEAEYALMARNEAQNACYRMASVDTERLVMHDVVIVSDGYNFSEIVKVLADLPRSVVIIGVNGVMTKWPDGQRMDYYVVNNPYAECMSFVNGPVRAPRVILSSRTYPGFVRHLLNRKVVTYKYHPTPTKRFGQYNQSYTVDDYRNPICAAIDLAHRFDVNRLALLGCDDSFAGVRPGSVLLENGLYTYPQHQLSSRLIDGMCFWLKNAEVAVVNCSSGPKLQNVDYIPPTDLNDWFRSDKESS